MIRLFVSTLNIKKAKSNKHTAVLIFFEGRARCAAFFNFTYLLAEVLSLALGGYYYLIRNRK